MNWLGQVTVDDARHGGTVLIVDDERELRELLTLGLTEYGYRVFEADGVERAQQLLRDHSEIDVVICDVRMPGGPDGTELAIWLYRYLPDTILILTSGYFERAEAEAGPLVYGHRLPKPFRPSQAAGLIRQCLAKRAAEQARTRGYRADPWA
jgi:DNA-binding NtrC family response regulator